MDPCWQWKGRTDPGASPAAKFLEGTRRRRPWCIDTPGSVPSAARYVLLGALAFALLVTSLAGLPLSFLAHSPSARAESGAGGGTPGGPPPDLPAGPVVAPAASVRLQGGQTVTTAVTYRNTSIQLSGGGLTVGSGGSLLLDNVSLTISEAVGKTPLALAYGIVVQSGGSLSAKDAAIGGANGSAYPAFIQILGSAHFFRVGFNFLGGTGSSPVAGKQGIDIRSSHVSFNSVLFNHTFQVVFDGPSAIGGRIDRSSWVQPTITGGQVGWLQVSGGAAWVNLTHDSFFGSTDAGQLALLRGPHVAISNSTFIGDRSGSQWYQVYLTYDGFTDSGTDASHALLVDDRFQTANLGISDGSDYTIERNWINDTGHWNNTGGQAAILVNTWLGSGVGQRVRQLYIEQNVISNFTHYAIRISQNVSNFNVSNNQILSTRSTYSSSITEADAIYLIRGVNNGTVWNNHLEMSDRTQPSEPTNGIVLEAQVNDVNVSGNQIYNCSEVGITVQGDSGALPAPSFYLGPSLRNVLYGNRIVNFHNVSAQSMYSTEAIETWMWANATRVVNNYIQGWSEVNATDYWNGAGILTSSSGQWFLANTMVDVRFGFVFEKFDGQQEVKSLGSFNRSYNVMASNSISQVRVDTLIENARDDMGALVNYLEGPVDPSWSFWFSGANATLKIVGGQWGYLNSSSPYRLSNIRLVGTASLGSSATTYNFQLSQWIGTTATLQYSHFTASIPTTAVEYDVKIVHYYGTNGSVSWTASQGAKANDTFTFGGLVSLGIYQFRVNGSFVSKLTASLGKLTVSWSGSGVHSFSLLLPSLVLPGPAPAAGQMPRAATTPSPAETAPGVEAVGATADGLARLVPLV